jgi:DDE family transposase
MRALSSYQGVVLALLRPAFPKAPCYARFIALTSHVWVSLTVFLLSRMGRGTDIYYIDSTALAVCHNRRIDRHKVFADLAAQGKTSTGNLWPDGVGSSASNFIWYSTMNARSSRSN